MSTDDRATARYHFSSAVDVLAAFEHLGIEHVEVSNKRTIVIYQRTIFNFDVLSGHLDTAPQPSQAPVRVQHARLAC